MIKIYSLLFFLVCCNYNEDITACSHTFKIEDKVKDDGCLYLPLPLPTTNFTIEIYKKYHILSSNNTEEIWIPQETTAHKEGLQAVGKFYQTDETTMVLVVGSACSAGKSSIPSQYKVIYHQIDCPNI